MKVSTFLLFVTALSIVIHFTKLNSWFPISFELISGLMFISAVLFYWETHRENKKREYLVNEIHGG